MTIDGRPDSRPIEGRLSCFASDLRCRQTTMGLGATARHMTGRMLAGLYRRQHELLLTTDLTAVGPPLDCPFRHEAMEMRHIPVIAQYNRPQCNSARTRRFADRLAQGAGGLVGFLQDEVIGHLFWADASNVNAVEPLFRRLGIELGEGDIYIFDLLVAPARRRLGVGTWLIATIDYELAQLGKRRAFNSVVVGGTGARRLFDKSGRQTIRRVESHVILSRFVRATERQTGYAVPIRSSR